MGGAAVAEKIIRQGIGIMGGDGDILDSGILKPVQDKSLEIKLMVILLGAVSEEGLMFRVHGYEFLPELRPDLVIFLGDTGADGGRDGGSVGTLITHHFNGVFKDTT